MLQLKLNPESLKKINVQSLRLQIRKKQLILTALLIVFNVVSLFAQDDVAAKVGEWGDQIKTILNAVVGVFSIAGGFLIFIQYMQGNEQAQRNFIRFIIGLAIFGLVALIANVFLPGANTDVDWDA
ncbi:hypothetical protein [Aquimarina sp. MMG016]|uniref:hypothetical protein n=1 Tax=Aquimarina sp. MMG016 TaxID=2822690 RepID=UPI001B3A20A8|nr:hypothetical protein [Aquimarina sp. MMG016]MBQ4820585.1 hypothetical protein [Aquimarina sp. MMG016]